MTEQQQQKQRAIDLLESRYRGMENVCEGIDMRLRAIKGTEQSRGQVA
jgi:hypothetical protein